MELSERQQMVLRAVVTAYVGEALPVGSATLSHLLPVSLSSASVRNTMAELASLGLIEKPHPSAGRLPTEQGLRLFVEARNVFDEEYATRGIYAFDFTSSANAVFLTPAPPRTIVARVSLGF